MGTRLELLLIHIGACGCVRTTQPVFRFALRVNGLRLMLVIFLQFVVILHYILYPIPPYTTNSAGFSATSESKLLSNIRSGASVCHDKRLMRYHAVLCNLGVLRVFEEKIVLTLSRTMI